MKKPICGDERGAKGALWAYSVVANVPAKTSTWQKHQYGGEFDE
jgi:hypothetical protein